MPRTEADGAPHPSHPPAVERVLALQGSAGNAAVARILSVARALEQVRARRLEREGARGAGHPAGILQIGILHCWEALQGMDHTGEVESRLKAARDFLRSQKSTLDRLGAGAPGGGTGLEQAKAAVYVSAAYPASADATRQELADRDTRTAGEQAWWKNLAESPGDYGPALALATEPVAREETQKDRAAKKATADAAKQAEATARRQERERRQVERRRRVGALQLAELRVLWWVLFLLIPSIGLGFWRIYSTLAPHASPTQDLWALFEAAPSAMIWGALCAGAFAALAVGALILLVRFEVLALVEVGLRRAAGFRLEPTGRNPGTSPWPSMTSTRAAAAVDTLGRCDHLVWQNPYHEDGPRQGPVDPDIDLPADLNAQDDDGLGWSTLADARGPSRVRPGAMLLAGSRYGRAVVRIVAVDDDSQVHFAILPGSVAKNRHLLGRTVA